MHFEKTCKMKESNTYKLGIDIGSTTLKICLLDKSNRLIHCDYRRHNASPEHTAVSVLEEMKQNVGGCRMAVRMTGSVGMGYAERMGIAFVQEVIAAGEYVKQFHLKPNADELVRMLKRENG